MIYEFIKNIIETKKPETWGVLKIVKQNKEIFSLTQFLPKNCKITEIYCHTSKKIGTENLIIEDYQKPEKFYVDLDTSTPIDQTFERLIKMLI
jgi:hypothetical protein